MKLGLAPVATRSHNCPEHGTPNIVAHGGIWCSMELEFAIFARYIEVISDGTFAMVGGGLNRLATPTFPAQVPYLALLARFKPSPDEARREHSFRVDVSGPGMARTTLGTPSKSTTVGPDAVTAVEGFRLNCAVSLFGFTFPAPGEFTFHIVLDDQEVGAPTLRLAALAPAGDGK
jgi:hypothetical protein